MNLSKTAIFLLGFGTAVGLLLILSIWVDALYVEDGIPTISLRVLTVAQNHPAVIAVISATGGLVIGVLLGHLFVPQVIVGMKRLLGRN